MQELPVKLVRKEVLLRYPVKIYTLDQPKFRKIPGRMYFSDVKATQLELADISDSCEKLVRKIYGLPQAPGIPLAFGYVKSPDTKASMRRFKKRYPEAWLKLKSEGKLYARKLKRFLKTDSIVKVKMPIISKGLPSGYKQVKVEQDLTRNPTAEAGMELMMH